MQKPAKLSPTPSADATERFVLEWGRMSSSWGINKTMAQIHALLLVTGQEFTVEEIMERLHISRGNASVNLRNLVEWGIIRRSRSPGDRKDTYRSLEDPFHVFSRVVRERKRREIDPTVAALEDCLAMIPEGDDEQAVRLRGRLRDLQSIFRAIDAVYEQVFATDQGFREAIELILQASPEALAKRVR